MRSLTLTRPSPVLPGLERRTMSAATVGMWMDRASGDAWKPPVVKTTVPELSIVPQVRG